MNVIDGSNGVCSIVIEGETGLESGSEGREKGSRIEGEGKSVQALLTSTSQWLKSTRAL